VLRHEVQHNMLLPGVKVGVQVMDTILNQNIEGNIFNRYTLVVVDASVSRRSSRHIQSVLWMV